MPDGRAVRLLLVAALSLGGIGSVIHSEPVSPSAAVKLGPIPSIKLGPRPPATQQQAGRSKALIGSFAEIEIPDYGLSPTLSGNAFSPLAGTEHVGTMLIMDHYLNPSEALRKLVQLGPSALPLLLDALDDKTPTKLKVTHKAPFGGMWHGHEIWGNPANGAEQKVLGDHPKGKSGFSAGTIDDHTITVGDICFVAIGQIVARPYQAVRYQPTACVVINSPTHDAILCRQVRAIWSSDDPARKLFDSLLLDFATEGVFNGKSLDGWGIASELQCAAAMRMLYYFLDESAQLIAGRLDRLNVDEVGSDLDAWMKRQVANGVRTGKFIEAVAWCEEPTVRAALERIEKRAGDPDVLKILKNPKIKHLRSNAIEAPVHEK